MDRRAEHLPVMDQGPRGTCAACAITAAHQLAIGLPLSAEDAFWLGKQRDLWPGEDKTSVFHILNEAAAQGHATELAWPYGNPAWPAQPPAAAREPTHRHAVPSFSRRGRLSFEDVKRLIPAASIVLTLAFVAVAWEHADGFVHHEAGIITGSSHAVVAIGSGMYRQHETLIIRNSWGAGWGDAGYGHLSKSYFGAYLLDTHEISDNV